MDWSLYPNLYQYIQKLPVHKPKEVDVSSEVIHWQQNVQYKPKPVPLKKMERLFLPFQKNTVKSAPMSHNESLWKIVCERMYECHSVMSKTYQSENVHYLIRELKAFVVKPEVRSILTSRRMYTILELLDKSHCEWTRQHQQALGFFLSFLFQVKVKIDSESYIYDPNVLAEMILSKNTNGYWSTVKIDSY